MINNILDKCIIVLAVLLYISDLLFPVWLVGIIVYLRKKRWEFWKAWGVASFFCLGQAYFVAKFIGWNLGAYTLISVGLLTSAPLNYLFSSLSITSSITPFPEWVEFWVVPSVIVVILPTLTLYIVSKSREIVRKKN